VGHAALHFMADGVHEMGFAHADSSVKEERIVDLGGIFCDFLGGFECEFVAWASDEAIELVTWVELGGGAPVKAALLAGGACGGEGFGAGGSVNFGSVGGVGGQGSKASIVAEAGRGGVLLGGFEEDLIKLEVEFFDGLFNELSVLFADVFELG